MLLFRDVKNRERYVFGGHFFGLESGGPHTHVQGFKPFWRSGSQKSLSIHSKGFRLEVATLARERSQEGPVVFGVATP